MITPSHARCTQTADYLGPAGLPSSAPAVAAAALSTWDDSLAAVAGPGGVRLLQLAALLLGGTPLPIAGAGGSGSGGGITARVVASVSAAQLVSYVHTHVRARWFADR